MTAPLVEPVETRRLILLRHGRTAWNHAHRVQGHRDVSLDDEGRAQAARTAPAMAALRPDVLWCSDLARARETAAPIAAAIGLEPTYDARLREFTLGEREGLTHEEYAAVAPEEFVRFRAGHYDGVPGAEQVPEVRARMAAVLGQLLASLDPGQTGLAVSHGAALRVAVGALLGWPEEQYRTLRGLSNCGWVVIDEPYEPGDLRMEAYNRVATA